MLLFIGRGLHGDCLVFEFQNILCYCLSVAKSVHEPPFLKFQNILCYCLSYIRFIQKELIYISKHLMLLFIFKASCNSQHFSAFQNILCYCLSSFSSRPLHFRQAFQNILCYCLSGDAPWIDSPLIFQNILCYCLSQKRFRPRSTRNISKHLMLLFIPYPAFIILTEL